VIKVAPPPRPSWKEKKARVEDAMHATPRRSKEGIVPGGGVTLSAPRRLSKV